MTLHYIFDPLCGWCYGASPLIKAARDIVNVQAHAGGMMTGARRLVVTPDLRQFVLAHDQRIAQMTGQPFGEAYINGLLRDEGAVFDSAPPITAILAAEQLSRRGLDLLARVQTAHYIEGLRISDPTVLNALAEEIGIDRQDFGRVFQELSGTATQAHIESSRALLARLGASGFPTLAIERDNTFDVIDAASYYGNLSAWEARLRQQLAEPAAASGEGFKCAPDGCFQ